MEKILALVKKEVSRFLSVSNADVSSRHSYFFLLPIERPFIGGQIINKTHKAELVIIPSYLTSVSCFCFFLFLFFSKKADRW